jgi:hypothetical protein
VLLALGQQRDLDPCIVRWRAAPSHGALHAWCGPHAQLESAQLAGFWDLRGGRLDRDPTVLDQRERDGRSRPPRRERERSIRAARDAAARIGVRGADTHAFDTALVGADDATRDRRGT